MPSIARHLELPDSRAALLGACHMNISLCCFLLLCTILESGSHAQSYTGVDSQTLPALASASELKPTHTRPATRSPVQRLVCDAGYPQEMCAQQMPLLRKTLARYPTAQLGDWTWVLVRSQDWKAILLARRLNSDIPAFTYLAKHETFIEEALVSPVPERQRELMLTWGMGRLDLLDFAIRHEMGHALCNDTNERNANRVAELLRSRAPTSCGAAEKIARK